MSRGQLPLNVTDLLEGLEVFATKSDGCIRSSGYFVTECDGSVHGPGTVVTEGGQVTALFCSVVTECCHDGSVQ